MSAADEDTGFECDEVRHFSDESYLGLYGGYIPLYIPRELQRAIDGLTDGNGFVGCCSEPFIECDIHSLDGAFYFEEIAFGARSDGSDADGHADVIEEEAEEQYDAVIEFAHLVEDVPDDHGEQSDDDADDDESFVVDDTCMMCGTDDDDEAGDDPGYGIEDLHEDADLKDGDAELRHEEHDIADAGCDESTQEDVEPSSYAFGGYGECSDSEGEAEAHDEPEERHLCFRYLHEIRQDAVHVILDIECESEPSHG